MTFRIEIGGFFVSTKEGRFTVGTVRDDDELAERREDMRKARVVIEDALSRVSPGMAHDLRTCGNGSPVARAVFAIERLDKNYREADRRIGGMERTLEDAIDPLASVFRIGIYASNGGSTGAYHPGPLCRAILEMAAEHGTKAQRKAARAALTERKP